MRAFKGRFNFNHVDNEEEEDAKYADEKEEDDDEEEKEDEKVVVEEATSSNIVNNKLVGTTDAGSERKKYLTAFVGSQQEPHGKTRKDLIHKMVEYVFNTAYTVCILLEWNIHYAALLEFCKEHGTSDIPYSAVYECYLEELISRRREEERNVAVAAVALATTATSSNIVNNNRAATFEAGSEQKEYWTAFARPQRPQLEPHGKTHIYSIHNSGMCLSTLLVLYY